MWLLSQDDLEGAEQENSGSDLLLEEEGQDETQMRPPLTQDPLEWAVSHVCQSPLGEGLP